MDKKTMINEIMADHAWINSKNVNPKRRGILRDIEAIVKDLCETHDY